MFFLPNFLKDGRIEMELVDSPIYVHFYVSPKDLQDFKDGVIEELYGYTEEFKSSSDTVHISVPLGKVSTNQDGDEFILTRVNFEREF
jgi:hypothetical protein